VERFAQGASSTAEPERPRRFSGTWARACCRILRARHSPRFGIDVETCARCGGRMRLLAFITDPPNVVRFLRHLGEATEPPPSSAGTMPARRSALRNSPSSKFRTRPTRRRLTPLTAGTPLERPTRRRSYGSFAVRKLCSPSAGPLALLVTVSSRRRRYCRQCPRRGAVQSPRLRPIGGRRRDWRRTALVRSPSGSWVPHRPTTETEVLWNAQPLSADDQGTATEFEFDPCHEWL